MTNPWLSADIAQQMRENVDRQLKERPWPIHFTVYADAVSSALDSIDKSRHVSVSENGCGVGHGAAILASRNVLIDGFTGIDVNPGAIEIARELYPGCKWIVSGNNYVGAEICVDGSCVLHVDDWRAHLKALCAAARDALILHRIPIISNHAPTRRSSTFGYGREFPSWEFSLGDVVREMTSHGFTHTETRKADGDSLTLTFREGR